MLAFVLALASVVPIILMAILRYHMKFQDGLLNYGKQRIDNDKLFTEGVQVSIDSADVISTILSMYPYSRWRQVCLGLRGHRAGNTEL